MPWETAAERLSDCVFRQGLQQIMGGIQGKGFQGVLPACGGKDEPSPACPADITQQMCYSLVSVMNVLEGSVAAVILGVSAVWICEGRKNIKIFVSILFMVLFSSVFYLFKQIMYGLFPRGSTNFHCHGFHPIMECGF